MIKVVLPNTHKDWFYQILSLYEYDDITPSRLQDLQHTIILLSLNCIDVNFTPPPGSYILYSSTTATKEQGKVTWIKQGTMISSSGKYYQGFLIKVQLSVFDLAVPYHHTHDEPNRIIWHALNRLYVGLQQGLPALGLRLYYQVQHSKEGFQCL